MCYNDQVLGQWQVNVSAYTYVPENDSVQCAKNFTESTTKQITLIYPNRAIDSDGYTGTWTMAHAQSVEVRVGGYVYFWQVNY